MSIRIFVNPSGQKDNLGDSILRRAYLDALRQHGQLHVFAGTHADYVSGLGLTEGDVVYRSRRSWLLEALKRNPPGGRMVFAMNAGEWVLDARFLRNSLWQTTLLLRSRLSGGRPVALGIAVRRAQSRWGRTYFRSVLGLVRTVSWRDPESRSDLRIGTMAPDWAFALGSAPESVPQGDERGTIAVVLRGDRPAPSDAWFGLVRLLAGQFDARIVVVNQMREDESRCAHLAEALGGEVLTWEADLSHADQEKRVREVYRDSVAVVSDRIHALIIGLTEGAVPVGFTTSDPEKVRRTFAAITHLPIAFSQEDAVDEDDALRRASALVDARSTLLDQLVDSRAQLERLGRGLRL